MDYLIPLNGAAPGPACVIPEDKKIFRVTADVSSFGSGQPPDYEKVPDCAGGDLPFPVPHMYSA